MRRRHAAGPRLERRGGKSGSYEDWTVDDLRKRAKELGLAGYSGKHKSELVSMLRNHRRADVRLAPRQPLAAIRGRSEGTTAESTGRPESLRSGPSGVVGRARSLAITR
jgi:hypothetical protein